MKFIFPDTHRGSQSCICLERCTTDNFLLNSSYSLGDRADNAQTQEEYSNVRASFPYPDFSHCVSWTTRRFWAESVKLMSIKIGAIDAPRPYGWYPGHHF
eukprot:scaffold31903_cov57-Attheya_sp.AAC.2